MREYGIIQMEDAFPNNEQGEEWLPKKIKLYRYQVRDGSLRVSSYFC